MFKRNPALTWFAVLATAVILLVLLVPPSATTLRQLHISRLVYKEIVVAIYIPYVLIWFSAFYAYGKLSQYTRKLHGSPEESGFRDIAKGTGLLALGLAIPPVISLLLSAVAYTHPAMKGVDSIIVNYVTLLFALAGFTYIGAGVHHLVVMANAHGTLRALRAIFCILAFVGVFFAYFALRTRYTQDNPYHLPQYALLATIIAPYLYTWFTGLVAAYELWRYSNTVKGVLYKQALNTLGFGIAVVIISSIIIQFVTSSIGGTGNLALGSIISILYGLFVIMAVGYTFVALGAKRLKRIEEV